MPVVKSTDEAQDPTVAIMRERCAKYRHQASTCARCVEVCPTGAVNLSANYPVLDAEACKTCGACASVCPTGALEMLHPTDEALSQQITEQANRKVCLSTHCKQAEQSKDSISVTCLAWLDPSALLLASFQGAQEIQLLSGDCNSCTLAGILPHLRSTIATTEELAASLNLGVKISIECSTHVAKQEPTEAAIDLSRRSFLRIFRKAGANSAEALLTPSSSIAPQQANQNSRSRELPVYLPEKRRRLIESLRGLMTRSLVVDKNAALSPIPQLDATRCTGCQMCAETCPTGALASEEKAEMLCISLDASSCVACNLCVDICPSHTISLGPGTAGILTTQRTTLLERRKSEDLFPSLEDRMGRLLGANIYRT